VRSTAVFSPENDMSLPARSMQRSGEVEPRRIALLRRRLDRRPAGLRQTEKACDLVECLPRRVVDGPAEPGEGVPVVDAQDLAMPTRGTRSSM
jgi:hypothetical protein